jgi:hypothetical protein
MTFSASAMTSGPMPSPGSRKSLKLAMGLASQKRGKDLKRVTPNGKRTQSAENRLRGGAVSPYFPQVNA